MPKGQPRKHRHHSQVWRPEAEWIAVGGVPAMIDQETWDWRANNFN